MPRDTLSVVVLDAHLATEQQVYKASLGMSPGQAYIRALADSSPPELNLSCRVIRPSPAQLLPCCNALFVTGSALNIWKDHPSIRAQLGFLRAAISAGVPVFGSCWGLQLLVVAAGGEVAPASRVEGIVARGIRRTAAGQHAPILEDKPDGFDAFAVHGDEVCNLPRGAVILARNDACAVQALSIEGLAAPAYGVQYHPEFDPTEAAMFLEAYPDEFIAGGAYADRAALEAEAKDIRSGRLSATLTDVAMHRRELANMLRIAARHRDAVG